jgi:hypothetical protein
MMADPAHRFTTDWFRGFRRQFKRHLMHLAGRRCRILEIGCFEWRATFWLLENIATASAARITCIDLAVKRTFWPNISASKGTKKVGLKIGRSRDNLPTLKRGAFDPFRLAKTGGIIGFDDYKWNDPKYNQNGAPKLAIDAFLKVYKPKIALLTKNYQVWARKEAD